MEKVDFVKMHGAGNDYIYVDYTHHLPADLPELARQVSERHFGIGADGLVAILPSETADFRMRMFNADGSEAQMCGNASRCIAKYVYDRGLTDKTTVTLETLAGIKVLSLFLDNSGVVNKVKVDMGEPILSPKEIPAKPSRYDNKLPIITMRHNNVDFEAIPVSMGNPHGVIFVDSDPDDEMVLVAGRNFEVHEAWPEKANVEFVRVISRDKVRMRVWERGSGETLACGTGACATVVAGVLSSRLNRKCSVLLTGGRLEIDWDEASGHVFMTGPATFVAEGRFFFHPPHH